MRERGRYEDASTQLLPVLPQSGLVVRLSGVRLRSELTVRTEKDEDDDTQ